MKNAILLVLLLGAGPRLLAVTEAELLAQADRHYRSGNYVLALEGYDELLSRYPLSDAVPIPGISGP